MNKMVRYIIEPWRIVVAFDRHIFSIIPDKLYLKCLYRCLVGKKLNLDDPVTYCEKLQWLKLYNRDPEYYKFTDKLLVRSEVAARIGEQSLIPLIGKYSSFDEINFDELPNRFVLKCSHDSGSAIICKDKSSLDYDYARNKLNSYLKRNFWRIGRETAYDSKGIEPSYILCEEYLYEEDDMSDFPDYKFFCFDGIVRVFQVNTGRGTEEGIYTNFYYKDGTPCDMQEHDYPRRSNFVLPKELDDMIITAEKLSKGFPHVRIDLLLYKGKIYFSEYTFYHCGGFFPFVPDKWNRIMGDYLNLPNNER